MFLQGKGSDWDKGHNVYCLLEATFTDKTVVEEITKFLRESRIGKALTDKTIVYESHVRRFWNLARYDEEDMMIHPAVRKKDKNGQDVDLEIKFGVEDLRRVLELGDSDDDPTIIPERLAKGLWCRMGFTGYINGKIIKTMFSSAYRFMIHCVVHSLSHRKGAYDETSDYIMNIIICLFKDIPKENGDILGLRNMTSETITRLAKGTDERVKRMICKINNPAYIAPENDRWRHENSSSDNEDERMNQMVEKKTRWWFVRDRKRKRTSKTSPAVPIQKEQAPKIVVKGPSKESQQKLVDEPVLDPSEVIQQGADLLKHSLESYLKRNEEIATQKDQGSSVQAEVVKATEPEGVVQDDSSEVDSEATESKSELDPLTLGRGKAQLKKKPTKKQKGSDEEDSTYVPPEKPKK
ncbi:hypothetical protein Hdeb2414_s0013g00415071 [Helianthus debilis subsp. tardiflorus]